MDNGIKSFLNEVEQLSCNALTVSKKLLAEGKEEVTVNLERRKVMPERMESPGRAHEFYDVPGFTRYVKANAGKHAIVLADTVGGTIAAVFNESETHGLEKVRLCPAPFPAFKMLMGMIGVKERIEMFAEQAMRNRAVLGETDGEGKEFAMLMQQITISSRITARKGTGRKSVNGIMCTTEVTGGPEGHVDIDLPDSIKATVPLYVNRPAVTFSIDLTILASHDEAIMCTAAPELEVLKYQEFENMLSEIKAELDADIQTSVGRMNYQQWARND